jgi:hypothetical protein
MICQQPLCWQIFYYRSRLSQLPSRQCRNHSYVAPVITATEPGHISVAAFAEIKTRCTALLVVTPSELVIRLNISGTFVVLVTVLKLTSAPAEGQHRHQRLRQPLNHLHRRRQAATRKHNPTRIASAVKAQSGATHTGSAPLASVVASLLI